jgi:alpha-L-fucosidase 2
LDFRLSHGGGHTGWSRSWTACFMARLGRAEEAWHHLTALISDFATTSLLDLHPPRIFPRRVARHAVGGTMSEVLAA